MLKLGKVCVCFHSNLTDQQPGTPLPLNVHWLYFVYYLHGGENLIPQTQEMQNALTF